MDGSQLRARRHHAGKGEGLTGGELREVVTAFNARNP
jgi:hypothetical protein